jgi:hypothetical protein
MGKTSSCTLESMLSYLLAAPENFSYAQLVDYINSCCYSDYNQI